MGGGHGYAFELDEELSDGDCVALVVTTPEGHKLELYAQAELVGRHVTLRQFAIYGKNIGAHAPRPSGLKALGIRRDGGFRCRFYPN